MLVAKRNLVGNRPPAPPTITIEERRMMYTQLIRVVGWSLMVGAWVAVLNVEQLDLTNTIVVVGVMIYAAILIK